MLEVVSVSLGSPHGDFEHIIHLPQKAVRIKRIGTNGRADMAMELLRFYDGKADVLCLGGINRCYYAGRRSYKIPLAEKLASVVKKTPLVDGNWIKSYWEPRVIADLVQAGRLAVCGKRVLLVSVLDRPVLASTFIRFGGLLAVGDAMFGLGVPIVFYNLALFNLIASLTLPLLRFLPLSYLYPLGAKQNEIVPRFAKQYQQADIIAGDFHFIYRHLPVNLQGKTIITSTVRQKDIELLRKRKLSCLITMAPLTAGRALGANVWEGVLTAAAGTQLDQLTDGQADLLIEQTGLCPEVLALN